MEGLIPYVYKAIMQYKNGEQGEKGAWLNESPSASYVRLPGDSGRFQTSDIQLLSTSSPPSSATNMVVATGVKSPGSHLTFRRATNWCYVPKAKDSCINEFRFGSYVLLIRFAFLCCVIWYLEVYIIIIIINIFNFFFFLVLKEKVLLLPNEATC